MPFGLIVFLFGVEVVGKGYADVVVQCVLPLVGLLIGSLATPAVVILVKNVLGKEPDVTFVLQDFQVMEAPQSRLLRFIPLEI